MTILKRRTERPAHHNKWIGGVLLGLTALTLAGCGSQKGATDSASSSQVSSSQVASSSSSSRNSNSSEPGDTKKSSSSTAQSSTGSSGPKTRTKASSAATADPATDTTKSLAQSNYSSGQSSVIDVNGGKSTLDPAAWKVNNVEYANLDGLNRTSTGNTAYLDSQNVANDSLRTSQTFKPTGYQQKFIDNRPILNRGHQIAYSLSKGISANGRYEPNNQSGDQNNPKNLFTQTAFSNQKVQTIYESKVRNALKQGKKVIYQVQPVFNGNDLMAKGVHMQAISTDQSLNYNVYLYNVQPGMKFDYATGRSTVDHDMSVPTPAGASTFHDESNSTRSDTSSRNTNVEPTSNHKKHHYVRDAVVIGAAHHAIKHHYQKKYQTHHAF